MPPPLLDKGCRTFVVGNSSYGVSLEQNILSNLLLTVNTGRKATLDQDISDLPFLMSILYRACILSSYSINKCFLRYNSILVYIPAIVGFNVDN